jgi:hypothetical protein
MDRADEFRFLDGDAHGIDARCQRPFPLQTSELLRSGNIKRPVEQMCYSTLLSILLLGEVEELRSWRSRGT